MADAVRNEVPDEVHEVHEVHEEERACIDSNLLVSDAGGWLGQQEGGVYPDNDYIGGIQHQGTSDELGAQASSYPSALLLHAPYNNHDFVNAPSASVARIASDPFAPFNSFDQSPDPGAPADPFSIPTVSYPQNGDHSQAQVDEWVHQNYSAPGHTVDYPRVETNPAPDGELGHEKTALRQLGQHASTNRGSRTPGHTSDPAVVQHGLLQGVGHLEAATLLREATGWNTSPQVFITPARLVPQRYPLGQPADGHDMGGHVYPHSESGGPFVNHDAYPHQSYFARAGLDHHATGQDYGGQSSEEYPMTSHDLGGMPPPVHLQCQSGPQLSHEAWPNQNSGPSQLGLGYNQTAIYQSPSADYFAHSPDVDGSPLPGRPAYMERNSDISAGSTHLLTPCSNESREPYWNWNSISATTPSEGNLTKKPRVSARLRSETGNIHAQMNFAGYSDSNLLSPTPNAPTLSRQPSSAGSATSHVCRHCLKTCSGKDSLRRHEETHDPKKMSRHKCPVCQRGFRYPKDMWKHWDARHAGTRVLCGNCGRSFSRGDNVTRHQKICRGGAASSIN